MRHEGTEQTAAPEAEPLSLAEAKTHLRLDATDTSDDAYVNGLIAAARFHAEDYTGRQLIEAEWTLRLEWFPEAAGKRTGCRGAEIILPYPPLMTVDEVRYRDDAGDSQVIAAADYETGELNGLGRVRPIFGTAWPSVLRRYDAVEIDFTAGYGDAADVPAAIKQAMLLLIGHWFANREEVITGTIVSRLDMAAKALLDPYRTWWQR